MKKLSLFLLMFSFFFSCNESGEVSSSDLAVTIENLNTTMFAYYPFNDNANDESGNGRNGTVASGATKTEDRFGNVNSAFNFNGTGTGFISTTSALPNEDITIVAWVNLNSAFANTGPIISNFIGTDDGTKNFSISGSIGLNYQYETTSAINFNTGSNVFPKETWTHIAMTFNTPENLLRFYVNGELFNEKDNEIPDDYTRTSERAFYIGGDDRASSFLNGRLDEVRIYDRVLSEESIKLIYDSEKP